MVNRYVEDKHIQRPEISAFTNKNAGKEMKPEDVKDSKSDVIKKPRPDTKEVSYNLFCQGMKLEDIAKARELVTGTIATHLEYYVRQGRIKIDQLVSQDKIEKVKHHLQQHPDMRGLTQIKVAMGDEVSYADIKLVLASI